MYSPLSPPFTACLLFRAKNLKRFDIYRSLYAGNTFQRINSEIDLDSYVLAFQIYFKHLNHKFRVWMALLVEKSIIMFLLLRLKEGYWMKYVDFTRLSNMVFQCRWRLITSGKWTMFCVEVKTSTIQLRLDFWFVSGKEKIVFLTQRTGWFIHDFTDCARHTFRVSHLIFKMYLFIYL